MSSAFLIMVTMVTGGCKFLVVCAEKGTNTIVVTYISAGGLAIHSLVTLKGTRVQCDWSELRPSSFIIKATPLHWISQVILAWVQFIRFLKQRHW